MATKSDLRQWTIDPLIFKIATPGPVHGCAIGERLQQVFLTNLVAVFVIGAGLVAAARVTFASEPGTLGVAVNQLYSEEQPTKRGALMVRHVDANSAAADAGMQAGDLILATDGKRVFNSELNEVIKRLAGPAGSSVELSVVQADGNLKTITLIRRPYPPYLNPPTDAFGYSIPGNWQKDPRYRFPLPWSPGLAFKGFEDLYFAPGFDDLNSPEYHSYVFLWWLDGKRQITAANLESDMVAYFRGLAQQRGRNKNFSPDPSQVKAQYASSSNGPSTFGGAASTNFSGTVSLYDRRGNVISLYSEVSSSYSGEGHTAVFFAMSKEPRPAALWAQLDAIRDGFRYRRSRNSSKRADSRDGGPAGR